MEYPTVDRMLEHNRGYAETHQPSPHIHEMLNGLKPAVLIVSCVDTRCQPQKFLGFLPGQSVEIRNGGGRVHGMLEYIVALDSLFKFQDIMIIHHTDCGATYLDKELIHQRALKLEGVTKEDLEKLWVPDYKIQTESLREDVATVNEYRFIRPELKARTRGYTYDIKTGLLSLVAN